MIENFNEQQFIERFGEEFYQEITTRTYNEMRKLPEFSNNKPYMQSLIVYPITFNGSNNWSLTVEASINKPNDFGFKRIQLSDESMPDETLDRMNDFIGVVGKFYNYLKSKT